MKLKSNYKFIFAGLLLLSLLACNGTFTADFSTPTSPVPTQVATLPSVGTPTPANSPFVISTGNFNETGQNSEYTINAQFPTILDTSDPRALAFNNEIQTHMQPEIADFKKAVSETPKDPTFAASSLDVKYSLIFQNATIVSIKFDFSGYISGAAHPYLTITTVNYDLAQSRQLTLSDLFLPNSNYLEVISNYCIAELRKQPYADSFFLDGAKPAPENYEDWNITTDGLMITFDTYQVAPGASGPQTVVIPSGELQAVINPQGPLASVIP